MEALLAMLLSDRFRALAEHAAQSSRSEEAERLRSQIRDSMKGSSESGKK
jgi:hypothetical protein